MRHPLSLQAQCSTHPKRFRVLLATLIVVALVAAGWTILKNRPPSLDEQLHGSSEDAVGALGTLQAQTPAAQRMPQLLRMVNAPQPGLRAAATDALAAQPSPAVAATLEQTYQDSSAEVRTDALQDLSKVDRDRGQKLLLRGLQDEDSWQREASVTQLRLYGDKRAVPYLIQALGDPDPAVPHLAQGVLAKLTGQKFAYKIVDSPARKQAVIRQWRTWWAHAAPAWPTDPAYAHLTALRPTRMDPAPDFQLTDVDGNPVSLTGQKGRVTLLNFWGTWCPPCQEEIPALVMLDTAERARGLDIVGVALSEDSTETLREWCIAHDVHYRQAIATSDIQEAYGNVVELPVSVMIDKQGRIRYRWDGERDYDTFKAAADRLLAEP